MRKKEVEDRFLYKPVILEDIGGRVVEGWLVPCEKGYLLLPFDDYWHTYSYKASHIKSLFHKTNYVAMPWGE